MAMFNNFPATYQNPYYQQQQPMYQQPQMQQPMQQQQMVQQQQMQNNNIIWVSGEAGAKSYLVAPNTTVQLWDSESQTIYLKSADASGMPSIKVIDYTVRGSDLANNAFSVDDNKFISRDEFNGLKSEFDALKSEISRLKPHKKEDKHNG